MLSDGGSSMVGTDHVNGVASYEPGMVRGHGFEGPVYYVEEFVLHWMRISDWF